MMQLRTKDTLDGGDFGWLKAKHHFIVDAKGNRNNAPLGNLIVFNDDEVAPGPGFGPHKHVDMEIITYLREGRVSHRDSAGNTGRLEAGDVQVMSAGTGIVHDEVVSSTSPVKGFQIWIVPRESGGNPYWNTKRFPKAQRSGRLITLASGFAEDVDGLPIRADARVLGATLQVGQSVSYDIAEGRFCYLVPAVGGIRVNGVVVEERDGLAITAERAIRIEAIRDTELVLIDAGPMPTVH